MVRAPLISLLCFTVVLMGVTGVHAHVALPEAPGVHETHAHHDAHIVSLVDADHDADHDEDGDIDVEPLIKAFGGKSTLTAAVAIVSVLVGIVIALARVTSLRVPVPPPLRPPKRRLRFFLLPPSHAPPASLH